VTLNASNVFGSNAFSRTNWVVVPALATAQYTYTLDAVTATFAGTVSGATGFTWRFPDGTTSTEENPAYTFPGNGTYTVVLEAVGACNTAMYSEDIVIAGALPTVTMTASETSGCAPLTVTFRDQSANAPTAWQWAFPGGTPATSDAPEVTVTYPAAGTYDVVLTVSNLFGSSEETWSEQITVADVPATPTFSRATLDGVYYEFFVEAPQSGLRYVWDFGDGSTNEGVAVGHSFTATGTYTVELRAFNDCGDSEAASVTVTIIINSTDTPAWATGLVLAPNPTQGMLQLQATDWPQSGQLNYTLVNTLGQPLLRGHWATQPGAWTGALDLATLPAGAYWLQLRHAADVWVVKVVKQ
jgi:PKD repeat protein